MSILTTSKRFYTSLQVCIGVLVSTTALAKEYPPVDCVIIPSRVADISSAVPGVIDELKVSRSEWVNDGQIVAVLENGLEEATVALARVRSEIDSEIKLGEVNLEFDEKQLKRISKLYERQAISFEVKDEADRKVSIAQWELQQAKDLKSVRMLELERAIEQLKLKTVAAPFEGFVLETFKSEGEYVEDQAILRVAQINPLLVEAVVPMELYGQLEEGMHGMVYPELGSDKPKQAVVVAVDRVGDVASRTFGVSLQLPNPNYLIPAGLKCEINFLPNLKPNLKANE